MIRRLGAILAVFAMLMATMSTGLVAAYHEDGNAVHPFADPRFEDRWERTDQPVADGEADRTWIWGPSPYTPGMMEPYEEAPDGERLVQYFDKSRMELNDPDSADNSIWVVTQGLLARDMMLGLIQVGDDEFVDHSEGPSTENVAGDPGADNGPTYAMMATVMDAEPHGSGIVIATIDASGTVGDDSAYVAAGVTAVDVDASTNHTVASVFWDFMNSQGVIWDGNGYTTGHLFADPDGTLQPFYAVGLPITEAYWARVRVGGTEKDVLVQCFERRCLTYTPDNPAGWQVEAGNVGQHYYRWLQTHDDTVTPPFDVIAEGLINPRGIHVHSDGAVYIAESGSGGETNCVEVGEDDEVSEICVGASGRVSVWTEEGGLVALADDLPSVGVMGEGSGPNDVYVTEDGRVFVVVGLGGPPEVREQFADDEGLYLGWIIEVHEDGSWTPIADVAGYEGSDNPDEGAIDSNPYSLVVVDDGFVVSDAGGNSLLWVSADGMTIETIAVLPSRMVLAPPFLGLPEGAEIPMESVPTGVAVGPDGAYYVGELTGFPFVPGMARVWRVEADGSATVYADGFTNIIDIAFDEDGDLLVLEAVTGGLLGAEDDPSGRLIHVDQDTMEQTVVAHGGLVFPAGVAVGAENMIYVANFAVMPMAQLIAFESPLP